VKNARLAKQAVARELHLIGVRRNTDALL